MEKDGAKKGKRKAASKPAKAGKPGKSKSAGKARSHSPSAGKAKPGAGVGEPSVAGLASVALQRQIRSLLARLKRADARTLSLERELRPFHVLADNISDHIYFKDSECRFLWVNRYMYKLRGLDKREDLLGKTSFDIHNAERAQ
ncbi:MAG: hypothetical protein ABIW76_07150, partial [Fibrobacteria bacterium]